jgi:hypothetical protein
MIFIRYVYQVGPGGGLRKSTTRLKAYFGKEKISISIKNANNGRNLKLVMCE